MPRILVGAVLSAVLCAGCANEMGLVTHRPFVGREMVAEAFVGYGGGGIYDAFDVQPAARGGAGNLFGGAGSLGFEPGAGIGNSPTVMAAPREEVKVSAVDPRRVVYCGSFDVVVPQPEKAISATKTLAEQLGGYVLKMTGEAIEIRVPAEKFDQAVAAIEKMGAVMQREVTAQDVTEEYEDLALRIQNARSMLEKLRELLGKAANVKEALEVEREIGRVRAELESLEGRFNRLRNRVAYATLTVTFTPMKEAPRQVRAELPFYWLTQLGLEFLMHYEAH